MKGERHCCRWWAVPAAAARGVRSVQAVLQTRAQLGRGLGEKGMPNMGAVVP